MENMNDQLTNGLFLALPYDELEELNVGARDKRDTVPLAEQESEYRSYLEKEKRIRAVTLCFSDLEGRFHMLDYDKKFLLDSADNLTFDGSSIRGFTAQRESDLRIRPDWSSFYWLPADLFGPGKVIMFANILTRDGGQYASDFRGLLQNFTRDLKEQEGLSALVAAEVEGFVLQGKSAEQSFDEREGFHLLSTSGYFHSLPRSPLREFIDYSSVVQRAMGYKNEKDHPEVAPSQFEMNFAYAEALRMADMIQLYKLLCRQVADNLGMTACFLPKPVMGINGSGMHINMSLAENGKNMFYDKEGKEKLSTFAHDFISRTLNHAQEVCLVLNASVNAYRRLDPHFEAPNQIQVSAMDRGSMVRIPVGNEKTARIEVRSVGPDANPYLLLYILFKTGLHGKLSPPSKKDKPASLLPGTIQEALELFESGPFVREILGAENVEKYLACKKQVAVRSPSDLGTLVKTSEIAYHHEVTNQGLWNTF
jgi:glutamine synthetase